MTVDDDDKTMNTDQRRIHPPMNITLPTPRRTCGPLTRSLALLWRLALCAALLVPLTSQALYWDANGSAAGAGGPTPTGTWGVDANWSTNSFGTNNTTGWVSNSIAVFSAGSDATGTY